MVLNSLLHNACYQCVSSFAPSTKFWIAYSGGVDSHVLLECFVALQQQGLIPAKSLSAVHVHHNLSANADRWQQHCAHVCQNLSVPFVTTKLTLKVTPRQSLEAVARKARYDYCASLMGAGDVLFTAHHRQDQAETVLLQLLRGAGPKGIAAMPKVIPFADGFLARPLLDIPQLEIRSYAQEQQLVWIEDESNQQATFARNYLRNQVMPMIKERWPSADATLSRSARLCAESAELLDDYAKQLLEVVADNDGLSIEKLKEFAMKQQKLVLRYWLHQKKSPLPSEVKLETLISNIFYAKPGRHPVVEWAGVKVWRERGILKISL